VLGKVIVLVRVPGEQNSEHEQEEQHQIDGQQGMQAKPSHPPIITCGR